MSSLGYGGGSSSGDTVSVPRGGNTGRGPGGLDTLAQIYADQFQRSQGLSDYLTGGENYGAAPYLYGQGAYGTQRYWPMTSQLWDTGVSAGGGGTTTPPPPGPGGNPGYGGATTGANYGGGGNYGGPGVGPENQDPDTHDPLEGPDQPGYTGNAGQFNENKWYAGNNPIFKSLKGERAPTGGLLGQYGQWQENPWQGTPWGDNESDVMGSYDWMSSGLRTSPEEEAYKTAQGLGQTNQNEQSIWNAIAAQGGYAPGMPGDTKNQREDQVWQSTQGLTEDAAPSDYQRGGFYKQMMEQGGMSPEAKAALADQTFAAARSPFEKSSDDVARMGAARGNPNAGFGAQIQMANQAAQALDNAANKNVLTQFGEERRQKEAGAEGLGQVQQQFDTRRLQGLNLQNQLNQEQRAKEQAAISNAANWTQQQRAGQKAATDAEASQNAALRNYQLAGAQGKQSMFNQAFGRKQAGVAGQQGIADRASQTAAGNAASLANILGQTGATTFHGINESGGI